MTDGEAPNAVVLLVGDSGPNGGDPDALKSVDGVPACRRAVEELPGSELVVACRTGQRRELEAMLGGYAPRFAVDGGDDRTVLGRLLAALGATTARRALVVDCARPFVDRAAAEELLAALEATEAATVGAAGAPRGIACRVEPARSACETALAHGSRQLSDALAALDVASVEVRTETPEGRDDDGVAGGPDGQRLREQRN
jgi:molybdopterin-guanine dinucleotide biosynthesis protein A